MIVARYWAASDREDDDGWSDDDVPHDPSYDDPADGPLPWYGENAETVARIKHQIRDSGRRLALFRKAETTLKTAAAMRGLHERPYPYYGRHGRRMGLYVIIGDQELHWSPRRGYRIVEGIQF